MINLLYSFLYYVCKLSLPIYFSDIEVIGGQNVPANGPCIIVSNHPNELLDVLVIGVTCGRVLSFWAKAPLFRGLAGKILYALGAVPVMRRMDQSTNEHGEQEHANNSSSNNGDTNQSSPPSHHKMDNTKLIESSFKAFLEDKAMCVFPEGTSHSESHLLQLKDGTSWTLFDFYAKNCKKDVPIIPCGITYINKHRWRSQVVIQYGKPILISKKQVEEFKKDPKTTVKKFTHTLGDIMYSLTVNAPDWETMKLLHTVRRIYMGDTPLDLAHYVEVTRRFANFYSKSMDNPEVKKLREDLAEYQSGLDALHLNDSTVRQKITFGMTMWKVIDRLFFLLILFPLVLPGFIVNLPMMVVAKGANYLTPYQESKATLKLLLSLLVAPIVYLVVSFAISYFFSVPFWMTVVTLVLLGLAHIRILEDEVTGIRSVVSSLRLIIVILSNNQRAELKRMRQLRQDLEQRVLAMVDVNAKPEERTLQNVKGEHVIGAPQKLVPNLIRRNSFSEHFL